MHHNEARILFPPLSIALTKEKSGTALCVSALLYANRDVSLKFVEWLEVLKEQGFSKVAIYVYALHSNVATVLEHYRRQGFVDIWPFRLSGGRPGHPALLEARDVKAGISLLRVNPPGQPPPAKGPSLRGSPSVIFYVD